MVAILRIYYLVNTSYAPGADYLWASTGTFVWSVIEPSVGVIVACAPVLGTALRQCIPFLRTKNSTSGKRTWPYSKSKQSGASQGTWPETWHPQTYGLAKIERTAALHSNSRDPVTTASDDEELLDQRSRNENIHVRNDYSVVVSNKDR